MARRRLKINLINLFNQVVTFVNAAQNRETLELMDPMMVVDVKFQIVLGHVQDIANRAVELDDPVILQALRDLGIVD